MYSDGRARGRKSMLSYAFPMDLQHSDDLVNFCILSSRNELKRTSRFIFYNLWCTATDAPGAGKAWFSYAFPMVLQHSGDLVNLCILSSRNKLKRTSRFIFRNFWCTATDAPGAEKACFSYAFPMVLQHSGDLVNLCILSSRNKLKWIPRGAKKN